jgi:hypothetical protein
LYKNRIQCQLGALALFRSSIFSVFFCVEILYKYIQMDTNISNTISPVQDTTSIVYSILSTPEGQSLNPMYVQQNLDRIPMSMRDKPTNCAIFLHCYIEKHVLGARMDSLKMDNQDFIKHLEYLWNEHDYFVPFFSGQMPNTIINHQKFKEIKDITYHLNKTKTIRPIEKKMLEASIKFKNGSKQIKDLIESMISQCAEFNGLKKAWFRRKV